MVSRWCVCVFLFVIVTELLPRHVCILCVDCMQTSHNVCALVGADSVIWRRRLAWWVSDSMRVYTGLQNRFIIKCWFEIQSKDIQMM